VRVLVLDICLGASDETASAEVECQDDILHSVEHKVDVAGICSTGDMHVDLFALVLVHGDELLSDETDTGVVCVRHCPTTKKEPKRKKKRKKN
jgi:hypothetical protein